MDWQHCEAISVAPFPRKSISYDPRRGHCNTSGTIDSFPHAIAE
ncbi:hypothetical protein BRPE64_ACDS26030 [Caballeronia insecticola]|uniref:Uncharacterized protein n=1 Tax=Caballeronia insecticola TaxID=758793 RepID=R4X0E2_9BURK|nr:hypothetical protein BRPE64_ACDS26030 [Caballeronia insecticola]